MRERENMNIHGWSREEIRNKALMAPCGLYCGTCGIYIATRDGNEKFKKILGRVYGYKSEQIRCFGCMQPEPEAQLFAYCGSCQIRECVMAKDFYSCHQCGEWPCNLIEDFIIPIGMKVMKRAIPIWREKVAEFGHERGSVEWARAEVERCHCSACGEPLFRGAQRCRACKHEVAHELDGTP